MEMERQHPLYDLWRAPQVKLRMSVDAISFSAHADCTQTTEFIHLLNPPHVVLVHGEAGEMMRLKGHLEREAKHVKRTLYTPKVTQPVKIFHKAQHMAKVCNSTCGAGVLRLLPGLPHSGS